MAADTDIHDAQIPDSLRSRFEFGERLGSGAAGTVYRAVTRASLGELAPGTTVAVKILRADRTDDAAARRQFVREAAVGRRVESEYVIRIHAAETSEDFSEPSFVVMEYVEGRTLRDRLEHEGPVSGTLARRIGADAARGLEALHGLGVVHRDVKPENLLLTNTSQLKLMDLGLAQRGGASAVRHSSSGGFHGTFAYAAPEVLAGREHGPAADLYALGVVLFEVVTGQHPFASATSNPDAMLDAHLRLPPPRASHFAPRISVLLDTVIDELLVKDPATRLGPASVVGGTLSTGEQSPYWRRHERDQPRLASERRLRAMRRPAQTAFFGRAAERRRLDRAWREARGGRGSTVHVRGPEASGRRRLCDEVIADWLESEHAPLFLGGHADRRTGDRPAAPFPELILDYLLRGDTADSPNAVDRVRNRAVELFDWEDADATRLAEIVCGEDDVGPATRADLFVRAILAIADSAGPTVVRIDRADRLDTSGSLIVRALAEETTERSLLLLLVGSSIPIEPGSDLPLRTVELGGLDERAFVAFGSDLFRDGHAPTALLRTAHRSLTGHPGALLESLEEFEQDGLLRGRAGDYHDLARVVTNLRPTRTALSRLRKRLPELSRGHRFVLQCAAVLGRSFDLDQLVELTGRPEIEVLEALASFDGRVVHTVRGRGEFAHRDIRRALLASIAAEDRRRLHRAAAWVLEDHGAAPLDVGMHLSRAGLDRECIRPLLSGLERLVTTGRRRVAVRVVERLRLHFNRLGEAAVTQDRLRHLLLSARVFMALGENTKARDALRSAIRLADDDTVRVERAEALASLAEIEQHHGHFVTAMQLLSTAEQSLESDDSEAARRAAARTYGLHSRVLAYQGDPEDALRLARRALDLAPADDTILRSHLSTDLGRWRALHTHFTAAEDSFADASRFANQSGDVGARMRMLLHRGRVYTWLGRRDAGETMMRECSEIAERVEDRRMQCRSELFLGESFVVCGQDGLEHLDRARALAHLADDRVTASFANALRILGGIADDTAHDEDVGVPIVAVTWHLAHGIAARRSGDIERANAELRLAFQLERGTRLPLPLRIALLRATGREAAARRLPESVAPRLPKGFSRRSFSAAAARWRIV